MSYYVTVETNTWVSEAADPNDDWDRDNTDGEISGIDVRKTYEGDDYYRAFHGMETELEPPFYVVYADYYTGDTFGRDYEACVVGIAATRAEAEDLQREAREFTGYGEMSNGFYVPWNGYFERLIGIYVKGVM